MSIRKATTADTQAVFDVRSAAILHGSRGHYPDELLVRWTDGAPGEGFAAFVADHCYVLEIDGRVCACGAIAIPDGQIDSLFVSPAQMGKGLGQQMLAFLEQLAREAGIAEVHLQSTLNAAPFYRRAGFVGDAIAPYHSPRGFSLDSIPMRKQLG